MPRLAIEMGIEPEYENALVANAWELGWGVIGVFHVPFSQLFVETSLDFEEPIQTKGEPLAAETLNECQVWFHGSIQAAKAAQAYTQWNVHAPWSQLRCEYYYPRLADKLLQREHLFTTIEGVLKNRQELWKSNLVVNGNLFFRPDGNDKVFTGGCIQDDDFEYGYKMMTFYDPDPMTRVVVAKPQKITAEARFLIVNGQVITGSFYKTGGQSVRLLATDSLTQVADEMLSFCLQQGYNPAPSWVLDLAYTDDWYIIEVGASSCCGMYKCNSKSFLNNLKQVLV